ncbi:MAG: hypothetical protein FWD80_06460 [Propionibacteriaceae bacterium]|nr:hypothetical protein [Propionibacteriaceae bacterium]
MTVLISDQAFLREFGSYLCSVRHGLAVHGSHLGTCVVCGTPLTGFHECWQCHQNRQTAADAGIPFPIDEIAFLTYAVEGAAAVSSSHEREGRQAYSVLKGYKAQPPLSVHWRAMVMWIVWSTGRWWPPGSGEMPWAWATVPSRKSDREGEHPLHRIVKAAVPESIPEVGVAAPKQGVARGFNPAACSASRVPDHRQVLLVEDLWVTGGNVLSAAAALKRAGAGGVSVLVLGRALNPSTWQPSLQFIEHDGLRSGFVPARSPWVTVV